MNDIKPNNIMPVPAYYIDNKEDEISLIDIFLVLLKRKLVILLTLLTGTALAVLVVFIAPIAMEKTTYATSIKIGGNPPLETNTNALTKLKESHIPITQADFKDGDIRKGLEVKGKGTGKQRSGDSRNHYTGQEYRLGERITPENCRAIHCRS